MSMEPVELADVIARAQAGEAAAFQRLIDAYASRLYGFFVRNLGRTDSAEDLLQEVFLRLVRMLPAYTHDGRFEAWLFRIASNLVRDRARRRKASVVEPALGLADAEPAPGGVEQPVDREPRRDRLEHAEEYDRLQQALAQISADDRQVLMLRHFGDLSFKQIAELMDMPLGTVLAKAHRALGKLRDLMDSPDAVESTAR